MKMARLWALLGILLSGSFSVLAQTNVNEEQGLKPYDSFHGGDLDSISMTNGALTLHIPLASFPQRGSLDLTFSVYSNTKNWQVVNFCTPDPGNPPNCSNTAWVPLPRGGLLPVLPSGLQLGLPGYSVDGAYVASSVDYWFQSFSQAEPIDPNNPPNQVFYDWSQNIVSPDGNAHVLASSNGGGSSGPIYPVRSLDPTGMLFDGSNLILSNGTRFSFLNGLTPQANNKAPSSVTDANGNQITISNSNGAFTDTLGRAIQAPPGAATSDLSNCPTGTVSANAWTIPGQNGGTRAFKFCYSNFNIFTSFGTGPNEYPATSTKLLSAIVLPDLTLWTLAYDQYGDVTRLGFPTGGSITYQYGFFPGTAGSSASTSLVVISRTVDANDGTGGHAWLYHYSGQTSGNPPIYSGKTVVSSPDGNDTVHTITNPVPDAPAGLYDTQVQYYQGSQSGGIILKTIATQYTGVFNQPNSALPNTFGIVPTQVTTISQDGHSSKIVNVWDSGTSESPFGQGSVPTSIILGSLLRRDEYDYSNNLVRSTLNRYLWQDNASYLTNNLISLPEWSTVYNGAAPPSMTLPVCSATGTPACIGQFKFTYDEGTPASSGIGTPTHVAAPAGNLIRGNLTTSSHWLDTAGAFISSTSIYFDTGMKATSTDPLLHSTSYTYSGMFLGAYLTQTNMPDTQMPDAGAPIVHHIISGNYDFNTGLLTSFTDENGQPYTYTYDSAMLRLTQGNHPDGGITKFFYPDPNTVERQRLISGTTYDDFKVKFDGLGRPYQTQQLTPDCGSYIKVDTGYDSVGRASKVSNPYCLTSEPTYGNTQTTYDALSRTLTTTKQDGSVTNIKYEDTAGDTSGAPLVCTTATDESGKKRQSCSDAFGRLVKVIEPNPSSTATNAIGSVIVSGTEQSGNSQPATPGQATLTISGTEQSVCAFGTCPPRTVFIYDSGTVTVTVNGVPVSASYSHTVGTDPLVASALKTAINASSTIPVTASCNDGTCSDSKVNLTAKTSGASTNYSFSTSAATSDGVTNFFVASFHASPSSGVLTGGQNASSTPDTGSVTATINGTPYSTSFGSSDTPTTIASHLATAITAGPYATATASGGTVNLTSKTAGTAGDFSLAASYTWNSTEFVSPSFTTSTSGSSLAGAKDAAGLNNNPFVTIYQYNARGDLLCVHQKATDTTADVACTGSTPPVVPATWRQRFFTYDSLSRLLTAMNPELNSTGSTVITYNYDNGSRLTSKVEPAPNAAWGSSSTVNVNYSYDALNRLLDTTYTDGTTPTSSHRYDYSSFLGQTFTNPIGREVAATAAGNTIQSFASYDVMGRVASTVQCNPGVTGCKTFTASYDKLGDLTTLGYPGNGFTVTYGYDSAARVISATDSNGVIYAQTPTYLANRVIKEFTSPNFNNNKYHIDYNNRLQPIEIWTGSAQGATALFDKQYSYGAAGTNNGNIYTITNVKDSTRTQSFTYDPLNRLLTAGDQTHWSDSYVYDAWGNFTNKNPGSPAGENLNKSADTNNHLSGLTYDAAGNVTNDGLGGVFVFDGENRIKTAGAVTYTYGADGRRIQKSSGTNYWYGPGGQALAETDSAGNWANYIFFGGQRLARNISGDIKYYITDHLHSTAMFVDKVGTVAAILDDNDMYPWGGVVPGVGKTTSNNTVKFTGQYRDTDTTANLDYFGARYYSNTIGRFMSPDWAGAPTNVPYAKFGDPQSLNLYSYVENGPINRIDPSGHCFACIPGESGGAPTGPTRSQERRRAYEELQQLSITTGASMATEQRNVPVPGFSPASSNSGLIVDWPCEVGCGPFAGVDSRLKAFVYNLLGLKDTQIPSFGPTNSIDSPANLPLPKDLAWILDIANGHGWDKHVRSLGYSRTEYAQHIQETVEGALENGDVRYRSSDGATAYWYDGTLVIHNPNRDPDKGSAYEPNIGREAFEKFGDGPPPINPE